MAKKFSLTWKRSKQARKQRKYRRNAPLHIKNRFLSIHLSKELRGKYNKKNITARKGDKVRVLRGQFKGKTGTIDRVDTKKSKVYVTGLEMIKKDGSRALYPVNPSNLMASEFSLDDKMRKKSMR